MAGMVKGPAIFLAQFAGDAAPFNSFDSICKWAASLANQGVRRDCARKSRRYPKSPRRLSRARGHRVESGAGLLCATNGLRFARE
jgi:hypothetical protein